MMGLLVGGVLLGEPAVADEPAAEPVVVPTAAPSPEAAWVRSYRRSRVVGWSSVALPVATTGVLSAVYLDARDTCPECAPVVGAAGAAATHAVVIPLTWAAFRECRSLTMLGQRQACVGPFFTMAGSAVGLGSLLYMNSLGNATLPLLVVAPAVGFAGSVAQLIVNEVRFSRLKRRTWADPDLAR